MVEEIKVTFDDKSKMSKMTNQKATKNQSDKIARKETARLQAKSIKDEEDLLRLRKAGIGLTGDAKKANAVELASARHKISVDKHALKLTQAGLKATNQEGLLRNKLTAQARKDMQSMGYKPDDYSKVIKKSVNQQMAAAKKMKKLGKPVDMKQLRMQKSITGQMREQNLLSRAQQGATTRNAMNYLSIMFIGQALQKVFKGLYSSATSAFQELTKGTSNASKGITMLQANLKYVQFTLGAAISDALLPIMDEVAHWAENISDFISKHPKSMMWLIFGGIAVGTIMSIVGQVTLLAASISNIMKNRAATKAISSMISDINGADTTKMTTMTKLMRGIGGLAVATLSVGIAIKMLEGKSDFADRLKATLSTTVGFAIAGAMIGSIFPGPGTLIGAGIGAAIGFIVGVSVSSVDYAKETGMKFGDFKQALADKFASFMGLSPGKMALTIGEKGLMFSTPAFFTTNIITAFSQAGKIADTRGEDFLKSQEGQQKLIDAYDAIQKIKQEYAVQYGLVDSNAVSLLDVRDQISQQLDSVQADSRSTMLEMMGFGGKISKKEIDDLQSWMNRIQDLQMFQDRESQLTDAGIAGEDVGNSFAAGYNNSVASIPETINDITQDSLDTLNDSLEDSNTLINKQSELLAIQAESAQQAADDMNDLARAQERYNRAMKDKEKKVFQSEEGTSSIYDF